MLLHAIGEHLLLHAGWSVDKVTDSGLPIPTRIRIIHNLVNTLKLKREWFYAFCYVTDREYFLMVINQIKYLWFLTTGKKFGDNNSIAHVFIMDQELCLRHLKSKQNQELFSLCRSKVQEKCEKLLKHYKLSRGQEKSDAVDKVWSDELVNTVKSLETTLSKCYSRFKTELEEHWELSKGYPATRGNDRNMKYRISSRDCSLLIVLEEIESLTQVVPPRAPAPVSGDDVIIEQNTSTQIGTQNTSGVSSSTIPPFQITASEKKARKAEQAAPKAVPDEPLRNTRVRSTSSTSKRSEEMVTSSQGDNLFGDLSREHPTRDLGPCQQTAVTNDTTTMVLSLANIEAILDMIVAKYLPKLGPVVEELITKYLPRNHADKALSCDLMEEPLPDTLESLASSGSMNLAMLLEDMELLDAQEAMKKGASDKDNMPEETNLSPTEKETVESSQDSEATTKQKSHKPLKSPHPPEDSIQAREASHQPPELLVNPPSKKSPPERMVTRSKRKRRATVNFKGSDSSDSKKSRSDGTGPAESVATVIEIDKTTIIVGKVAGHTQQGTEEPSSSLLDSKSKKITASPPRAVLSEAGREKQNSHNICKTNKDSSPVNIDTASSKLRGKDKEPVSKSRQSSQYRARAEKKEQKPQSRSKSRTLPENTTKKSSRSKKASEQPTKKRGRAPKPQPPHSTVAEPLYIIEPVIKMTNTHKAWCAARKESTEQNTQTKSSCTGEKVPRTVPTIAIVPTKVPDPSIKDSAGSTKAHASSSEVAASSSKDSAEQEFRAPLRIPESATIGTTSTEADCSDEFVEKVPLVSVTTSSDLPPSIERTSELKPKTRPLVLRTRSSSRKRRRRTESEITLVTVSEDEDSLPDPDLSLDLRDFKVTSDNSTLSLLPLS